MHYLVKQAKTGVSPSLFQRSPPKLLNHLSYACLSIVITGCQRSSFSLDLLNLGYSHLRVRIPDSRSIFQLQSYKEIISRLTYLWHLCFDVVSIKFNSPICIISYMVNMRIPGEATKDINPKIPGTQNRLQSG